MAADGSGSGFTKVTPVYTKPGAPVPVPFSVTGDVPPPAPLPLTGDETFTVYVDDIPMFTTIADALDTGVSSFNGRGGAVTLTTADITGAGGAPIDSPVFTGDPQAPTPTTGDNSNSIATTEFVTTAVDATFQDFLPITGGTLAGPGNLTVGGILSVTGNTVTSGIITNNAGYYVASSGPGAIKGLELDTGNLQRWTIFSDNTAEVGANAGSNFQLSAYSDQGALLNTPISIQRSTGLVTMATGLTVSGGLSVTNLANFSSTVNFTGTTRGVTPVAGDSSTLLATTAFVTSAIGAIPPGGVTSFNGREGAITLTTADITGAGGATTAQLGNYLPLTGGTLSGPGNLTVDGNLTVEGAIAAPTVYFTGASQGWWFATVSVSTDQFVISAPIAGNALLIDGATGVANFTSIPTSPTPTAGDDSTNIATTAFVTAAVAAGGGGPGGGGTVTSVGLAATPNTVFGVVNSPVTSSGTINLVLNGQPQNSFLAAPVGGGGIPNFRLIQPADLPDLSGTYLPLTGGTLTGPLVGTTISTSANITSGTYYNFGNSPANWYMWYDATATQWKFSTPSFSDAVAFTAAGAITTRGGLTLRGNAVITGSLQVTLATTLQNTLTVTGVSALNGGSTTVTRPPGDNTTNIATTAFVDAAIAAIPPGGGGGIPEAPTDGQIYGREGSNTSWQPVLPLTGGTLTGPGNLTLVGGAFAVSGSAGTSRMMFLQTNLSNRWAIFAGGGPESGGNVNSDFNIQSYDDTGALLRNTFAISRATGTVTVGYNLNVLGTAAFSNIPTAPTPTAGDNSTNIATTAFVHNAVGAVGAGYLPLTGGTLSGPGNLTVNGNLIADGNLYANGNIIYWGTSGWYVQLTTNLNFEAPNGSCYMDTYGNFVTNAAFYSAGAANIGGNVYANGGNFIAVNPAGTYRGLQIYSGNELRWWIACNTTAESGANAGSDFFIANYDDSGNNLDAPLQITRATGNALFTQNLTVNHNLTTNGALVLGGWTLDWGTPGNGYYDNISTADGNRHWYTPQGETLMSDYYGNLRITSYGSADGNRYLALNGNPGTNRMMNFESNGVNRWGMYCTATAESGSNAGSDFVITAANDSGAWYLNCLSISRASGNVGIAAGLTTGGTIAAGSWIYSENGGRFVADGPAGDIRGYAMTTSSQWRWFLYADTEAETGSNAGSNLILQSYSDAGSPVATALTVNRASGAVTLGSLSYGVTPTAGDNSTALATTAFVHNAIASGPYLPLTGGALSGSLEIDGVSSTNFPGYGFIVNAPAGNGGWIKLNAPVGQPCGIVGSKGNSNRWSLYLGDATTEGGSNSGSNFVLGARSDSGTNLGNPLVINRVDGSAVFNGYPLGAALVTLNKSASGLNNILRGSTNLNRRWEMVLGDGTAEAGSNAGSNFGISGFDDTGNTNLGLYFQINRASGVTTHGGAVDITGVYPATGDQAHNGFQLILDAPAGNGAFISLNAPAGSSRGISAATAGSRRWTLYFGDGTAESGGNAGSNIVLQNFNDSGNGIANVLTIIRSSGLINFGYTPTVTNYPPSGGTYLVVGYFASGSWYNAERAGVAVGGGTGVFFYNNGGNYTQWSTVVSDRRLKSNLKPAGDALSFVKRLAVYDLDFKPKGSKPGSLAESDTEHWPFSLIADEVGEVMPHAAIRGIDDDADQWVGLHPLHLVSTLWKAVQELSAKVEALEARLGASA